MKRDYFGHVKMFGYAHCPHIPRQHGEQISLLTEIVDQNKKYALFRVPSFLPSQKVKEEKNKQSAEK